VLAQSSLSNIPSNTMRPLLNGRESARTQLSRSTNFGNDDDAVDPGGAHLTNN